MDLSAAYGRHFLIHGNDSSEHARHYLSGLLGTARRKNIGRIEEDVARSNYQGLQQFISDSPWDHRAVLGQVAAEADALLGRHRDTALYLDETSFVKKGAASVGVQRQYCGRLGKLENCQVGVFAALGRGERVALIDFRLFVPREWAEDESRCQRAKIPVEERVHRTKAQLALALVEAARARGSSHQWIGGDEIYGNNRALTDALEELGETFLMDVAHNLQVWASHPRPAAAVPVAGRRGRPVSRRRATETGDGPQSVAELARRHFARHRRWLTLRETTKGPLRVELWAREVWLWSKGSDAEPRRRWLVVRREANGTSKYSLSNAPKGTSWQRLGWMQAQRFFIERAFQDAKSELGLAQYEVRGWRGWHHHMALGCLALLFTLKERLACTEALPLLSVRDLVELLAFYLPRKTRDPDQILTALHHRHTARSATIQSAAKRAKKIITK